MQMVVALEQRETAPLVKNMFQNPVCPPKTRTMPLQLGNKVVLSFIDS